MPGGKEKFDAKARENETQGECNSTNQTASKPRQNTTNRVQLNKELTRGSPGTAIGLFLSDQKSARAELCRVSTQARLPKHHKFSD